MSTKKNEIINKINQLTKKIIEHNENYHTYDNPKISDEEYDALYSELKKIENSYPELASLNSPTKRVGAKLLGGFKKVEHKFPMLSLSNASDQNEFKLFYERICKDLNKSKVSLSAEPKFDGLAISLTYRKGLFHSAVTRGDGVIGEDVSINVRTIKTLPLALNDPYSKLDVVLKAEIYMNISDFNMINSKLKKNNEKVFANPRNIAAGTIRQLDPKITSKRNLQIFIHGIIEINKKIGTDSHINDMQIIKKMGFNVCEHNKTVETFNDAIKYYEDMNNIRQNLPYEIDGIVFKIDSYTDRDKLGETSKAPRWSIAYKFRSIEAQTRLKTVSFQVGRTGTITPVAELEPVNIGGVTISRASLHNMDEIQKKDIRINDIVYVKRAGDVIPDIDRVNLEKRGKTKPIKMPSYCPACNSQLKKVSNQTFFKCENSRNCKPQIIQSIQHFASRKAMNISGLGEGIIELLIDNNLLTNYSDLYYISFDRVKKLERMGELSSSNLQQSIDESRDTTLDRLIYALGINEVGYTTAKILSKHYTSIEELSKTKLDSLETIKDIGPVVAKNIVDFFKDNESKEILKRILNSNVNIKNMNKAASNKLDGLTFVITGSFKNYSRKSLEEIILNNGGSVSSSISKKTSYLVLGSKPGSKHDKAKNLKVKIIDEKNFSKLL